MGQYNYHDMTGEVIGKLTVKGRMPREPGDNGSAKWLCLCECGNVVVMRRDKLIDGRDSCGCTRKKVKAEKPKAEPKPRGRPAKAKPPVEAAKPKPIQNKKPIQRKPDRPRPFSAPDPKRGKVSGFSIKSKCKHCKKIFERPFGEWGWKTGRDDYFCTYKCMRADERERMEKYVKGVQAI